MLNKKTAIFALAAIAFSTALTNTAAAAPMSPGCTAVHGQTGSVTAGTPVSLPSASEAFYQNDKITVYFSNNTNNTLVSNGDGAKVVLTSGSGSPNIGTPLPFNPGDRTGIGFTLSSARTGTLSISIDNTVTSQGGAAGTLQYEVVCNDQSTGNGGGGSSGGSNGGGSSSSGYLPYIAAHSGKYSISSSQIQKSLKSTQNLTTAQSSASSALNNARFLSGAMQTRLNNLASGQGSKPTGSFTFAQADGAQGAEALPADVSFTASQFENALNGSMESDRDIALALAGAANNVFSTPYNPYSVWIDASYSHVSDSKSGGDYDGGILNFGVGVDYALRNNLVVGLALNHERSDIDTDYNDGEIQGRGWGFAPYVAYQIDSALFLDASVGYTRVSYDVEQFSGAVDSDFNANRYTFGAGINGAYAHDKWRFRPRASVIYLREHQNGYSDNVGTRYRSEVVDLGRVSGGTEVGYIAYQQHGETIEPYAIARGEVDFIRPDKALLANGQTYRPNAVGGVLGGGVNYMNAQYLRMGLEGTYEGIGRAGFDGYTLRGRVSHSF